MLVLAHVHRSVRWVCTELACTSLAEGPTDIFSPDLVDLQISRKADPILLFAARALESTQ